jgi:hypothetical protein
MFNFCVILTCFIVSEDLNLTDKIPITFTTAGFQLPSIEDLQTVEMEVDNKVYTDNCKKNEIMGTFDYDSAIKSDGKERFKDCYIGQDVS